MNLTIVAKLLFLLNGVIYYSISYVTEITFYMLTNIFIRKNMDQCVYYINYMV